MSGEPLPLPEIWSDPREGEVELAHTEFAIGRGSRGLIDTASGGEQHKDPSGFVRAPAPAAPVVRGHLPGPAPAALSRELADLASIVSEAEALLRAPGILKSDVHFAVEHIHDVAMALRMREVEEALCDTLDKSVREVGDALVRHEAAAGGAASAAALLRDIIRRLDNLTNIASGHSAASMRSVAQPSVADVNSVIQISERDLTVPSGDATVIEMTTSDIRWRRRHKRHARCGGDCRSQRYR